VRNYKQVRTERNNKNAAVTRRLALTQLLWAESERNMVASVRD
jgi:hypothetical protein